MRNTRQRQESRPSAPSRRSSFVLATGGIVDYYRTVAEAADLPLFVYNLPQATGVNITPDLMQQLQDNVPQLTGLKHSAPDMNDVYTFARMGLRVFTGMGRMMLPALTVGAAGCVDGPPCLAPRTVGRHMGRLQCTRPRPRRGGAGQSERGHGLPDRSRLHRRAEDCGRRGDWALRPAIPRPPNLGATPEQKTDAREAVHRLGLAKVA